MSTLKSAPTVLILCLYYLKYERELEQLKAENLELRTSHNQAVAVIREMEIKLNFSESKLY